jgi:hypothetical protein
MLAETGMRLGEVLGLRISDVVPGRGGTGYIEIVPREDNPNARVKMMRPRRVYVGPDLERLLADYLTHLACRAADWGLAMTSDSPLLVNLDRPPLLAALRAGTAPQRGCIVPDHAQVQTTLDRYDEHKLNLAGLPDPFGAELAWMAYWQEIIDGTPASVQPINQLVVALRLAQRRGHPFPASIRQMDADAADRLLGWYYATRWRRLPPSQGRSRLRAVCRYARLALIVRCHDGPWWELDDWHPRSDPRIPLTTREPRARQGIWAPGWTRARCAGRLSGSPGCWFASTGGSLPPSTTRARYSATRLTRLRRRRRSGGGPPTRSTARPSPS